MSTTTNHDYTCTQSTNSPNHAQISPEFRRQTLSATSTPIKSSNRQEQSWSQEHNKLNPVSPAQSDVASSPLSTTGNIFRSALTTLDEFGDDVESLICLTPSLHDSEIIGSYSGLASSEESELYRLREKVSMLEKENKELKHQLNASNFL